MAVEAGVPRRCAGVGLFAARSWRVTAWFLSEVGWPAAVLIAAMTVRKMTAEATCCEDGKRQEGLHTSGYVRPWARALAALRSAATQPSTTRPIGIVELTHRADQQRPADPQHGRLQHSPRAMGAGEQRAER